MAQTARLAPSRSTTNTPQTSGRVYLTGTQALVRLPMMQRQRDQAAGLNTAGFITGYRGSPLGGLDQALVAGAGSSSSRNHIHFQPGVNEDLAATAVWGTPADRPVRRQQVRRRVRACGTARARASTAPATCSATPTSPAPSRMAACWCWPATTTPANPRPPRTRPNTPSWTAGIPVLNPGERAGDPGLRPAWLGDVALFRLLGRR